VKRLLLLAALVVAAPLSAQEAMPRVTRDIVPALRPNDSVKKDVTLPWVSVYQAPAIYAKWWREVANCEHLVLPVELEPIVRFVQVNSSTFRIAPHIEEVYGYTQSDRNTIILAQSKVLDESTVKHEMTHQLDWWNGVDEGPDFHPFDTFEACGLHVTEP